MQDRQKRIAAITSGDTPNIARVDAANVRVAQAGLLLELDQLHKQAEDKADFVPVALAERTVDGRIVRFPWNFGTNGMGMTNLIYPQMFEQAGVELEES